MAESFIEKAVKTVGDWIAPPPAERTPLEPAEKNPVYNVERGSRLGDPDKGNIKIEIPNSPHSGYYRPDRFEKVEADYQKHVVDAGRNVPRELWYGTAMQESSMGKANEVNPYAAIPRLDAKYNKTTDFSKFSNDPKQYGDELHKDYAAYKLQEGLDKYQGDVARAAVHYNSGRGTKQHAVPEYGKQILAHPRVQKIIFDVSQQNKRPALTLAAED